MFRYIKFFKIKLLITVITFLLGVIFILGNTGNQDLENSISEVPTSYNVLGLENEEEVTNIVEEQITVPEPEDPELISTEAENIEPKPKPSNNNTNYVSPVSPPLAKIIKPLDGHLIIGKLPLNDKVSFSFSTLFVFTRQESLNKIQWFIESASMPRRLLVNGNNIQDLLVYLPLDVCQDLTFKITVAVTNPQGITTEDSSIEKGFNNGCPKPPPLLDP